MAKESGQNLKHRILMDRWQFSSLIFLSLDLDYCTFWLDSVGFNLRKYARLSLKFLCSW